MVAYLSRLSFARSVYTCHIGIMAKTVWSAEVLLQRSAASSQRAQRQIPGSRIPEKLLQGNVPFKSTPEGQGKKFRISSNIQEAFWLRDEDPQKRHEHGKS